MLMSDCGVVVRTTTFSIKLSLFLVCTSLLIHSEVGGPSLLPRIPYNIDDFDGAIQIQRRDWEVYCSVTRM